MNDGATSNELNEPIEPANPTPLEPLVESQASDFTEGLPEDLDEVGRRVMLTFKRRFLPLLSGSVEDVDRYAVEIARNLVDSAATGDEELGRMCQNQVKALAAKNRVEASRATWGLIGDYIVDLFSILVIVGRRAGS